MMLKDKDNETTDYLLFELTTQIRYIDQRRCASYPSSGAKRCAS
jgi:hypothetical protein